MSRNVVRYLKLPDVGTGVGLLGALRYFPHLKITG
jgi:hypothetical protein